MKLLIISNTEHFINENGNCFGWGPTVNEINYLSKKFSNVYHIAPLTNQFNKSMIAYNNEKIQLIKIKKGGGNTIADKIKLILLIPSYIKIILNNLSKVDIVHVRCPANISLIAIIILFFTKKPKLRWIKYAGNWNPHKWLSFTSMFQKHFLNYNLTKSLVTINGSWDKQPLHVKTFLNPSFRYDIMKDYKKRNEEKNIRHTVKLIFSGRIEPNKGIENIISILEKVDNKGINFEFTFVGGGDINFYKKMLSKINIKSKISFIGWVKQREVFDFFSKSHIIIFPSKSEGWPKVLSEAMMCGVVPLASKVGAIPQVLKKNKSGFSFEINDIDSYANKIEEFVNNPLLWKTYSIAGMNSAKQFTYESYVSNIDYHFNDKWGIKL